VDASTSPERLDDEAFASPRSPSVLARECCSRSLRHMREQACSA
jgi:hypothetical protein